MFGLCTEATIVALLFIILVIFIFISIYDTKTDELLKFLWICMIAVVIFVGIKATKEIQHDYMEKTALNNALNENYKEYTNLNEQEHTFVCNNRIFSYKYDYAKNQLTIFDNGPDNQTIDNTYINGKNVKNVNDLNIKNINQDNNN